METWGEVGPKVNVNVNVRRAERERERERGGSGTKETRGRLISPDVESQA